MNYVQFHVGDWDSSTKLLSPLEKGIYIDLLMLYYSTERPIIRSYFDRITKVYTNEERKAFDYVISEFFEEREDGFHQRRCDEEIAKANEKSLKAKKSIQARWDKARRVSKEPTETEKQGYERNTNVIRTNNERNTDVILTNNQEPITNIYTNVATQHTSLSPESDPQNGQSETVSPKEKNPPIPYEQIVDLYNKMCVPGCVACLKLTPSRKQSIRLRAHELAKYWEAETQEEIVECFRRIFKRVSDSDFLMGRCQRSSDHANFKVDLSWILKSENLTKILEEKYA